MCQHSVLFYETDQFLCDKVVRYTEEGLASGESVILIATRSHLDTVNAALVRGLEAKDAKDARCGKLITRNAEETLSSLLAGGWPDAERCMEVLTPIIDEASENGKYSVRAFGEMVALLCAAGRPEAAVRLEHLWNELAHERNFSLLCAYPMGAFIGEELSTQFAQICAAHSAVLPTEEFEMMPKEATQFHRTIATLQQKAKALEFEVSRRKQSERALTELAAHQERIREEERKRIAQEVHDELGGLLTGIKAYVSVCIARMRHEGHEPNQHLIDASKLADDALETVRRVVSDLRPSVLDQLGIWAALEWYVDQIQHQTGLSVSLVTEPALDFIRIDPDRSTAVFRIVQEGLTNAVRHSEATAIVVRVRGNNQSIVIEISDNGKGIAPLDVLQRQSWGLAGMHERARHVGGELRISGAPDTGTIVALHMPLGEVHGVYKDQSAAD